MLTLLASRRSGREHTKATNESLIKHILVFRLAAMFWYLGAALLLLTLANADLSVPVTEGSTASHLEESVGQSQEYSTKTSSPGFVTREISVSGLHLQKPFRYEEGNTTFREVFNATVDEEPNISSGEMLNITDEKMNIFTIHNNISDKFTQNKNNSDDRPSFNSDTSHFVIDGKIFHNNSDEKVYEAKNISSDSERMYGSNLYFEAYDKTIEESNAHHLKPAVAIQKEASDQELELSGIQDKNDINVMKKENLASLTVPNNVLTGTEVKNVAIKIILKTLLNNLNQITEQQHLFDALKPLGMAIQNITLPDYPPFYEDIVSNDIFTLGIFPTSIANPAKGVYMGTKWQRWDVGVPRGGHITDAEPLENSATLGLVIGVAVEGIKFKSSALFTSHWNTTEIYTILYETHYFEHKRTVDVFFYDADGDEEAVQVFWEPFSMSLTRVRCEAWVLGHGWDGRLCDVTMFGAGLVGCRCPGSTFSEGDMRRARFLVVEESDTKVARADEIYFDRAALYLHSHEVDRNGLADISKLVKTLLSLKPDIFYKIDDATGVLLDIGTELHKIYPKNNGSGLIDVSPGVTLAVIVGGTPISGMYLRKQWPTYNPDDATFHATGLRPGGSWIESQADTEVFAVRIAGNVSLPRRVSLLLSSWEKKNALRRYFFKVVYFTQRVADLVFSAEDDAVEGDEVDIVFETATKDWTNIHCRTWNFNESLWDGEPCSSKNISSRLYSCKCPKALFKIDDLLRTRIHIAEESFNHQFFVDWDLFNRTSHHLSHLTQLSLPGDQLSNLTAMLDTYVLRKVRSNGYNLPKNVLDSLTAILHNLDVDPHNHTAFAWRSDVRSTASLFVNDRVDDSLAIVAISEKDGHVWNSTHNDVTDSRVAMTFSVPQNGVGRVTLTYVTTTSRIQVEDRIIYLNRGIVDVTWRQTSSPPTSLDVVIHLKPFADSKRPVTVSSKTCFYWDFDLDDWSDGCAIRLDSGKEICKCKIYLKNDSNIVHARFHIASDWSEQNVLSKSVPFFLLLTSELTLQMLIFHTGCALSLFGLVTVFVTALAFKSWRQRLSNKILLHICSALLLQILSVLFYYVVYHPLFFDFFDFVPQHREWTYLCLAMGVVWSYSYLARWCWMLVMSLLQLMRIVTVMGARNVPNLLRKVSIFAWGGPFIVLGYFLSDPWAYFDDFNRRFYFLTYLLPLSVVLVANLAVFATILARAFACCGWGKMVDLERHGANSWLSIWKRLRTVIVLFFTLEMTWLFEMFIYFGYYNSFLHVMSFVVTAFHGFGMFVVFVVLDGDAQAGWRAALRSPRSWRNMALLYCAVLGIIGVVLGVVVVGAVLLVCLHTLA